MHQDRETEQFRRNTDVGSATTEAAIVRGRRFTSESLSLRNYDHRRGHDLVVEARRLDGDGVFERRYFLQPGGTVGETDALPSGTYELTVELDGNQHAHLRCRLDDTPHHTAVVEVGNGVLSVTEGLVS